MPHQPHHTMKTTPHTTQRGYRSPIYTVLLSLFALLLTGSAALHAQNQTLPVRQIFTDELWNTNQVLSTSIVIKEGATLYLGGTFSVPTAPTFPPTRGTSGLSILFEYVDENNDGVGDLGITIEPGAALVINTTGQIVFGPSGTKPDGSGAHWAGLQWQGNEGDVFDLGGARINGAQTGVQLSTDGSFFGGVQFEDVSTAVEVNADNIRIAAVDVVRADTAFKVFGNDVHIRYSDVDSAGVGFWMAGADAQLEWVSAQAADLGLQVANSGLQLSNSEFSTNEVGVQVDATGVLTADNTIFSQNTTTAITSSGQVRIDGSTVSNNTAEGIIINGGTFSLLNSASQNNGGPAVRVLGADSLDAIVFNRNNLSGNDAEGDGFQAVVSAEGLTTNFYNNWWGVSTRVDEVISAVSDSSILYSDFRIAGPFLFNEADLNISRTITFDNFVSGGSYSVSNDYRFVYQTTGNVARVRFTDPVDASTVLALPTYSQPNFGFIDIETSSSVATENGLTITGSTAPTGSSNFGVSLLTGQTFITTTAGIQILDTGTSDLSTGVAAANSLIDDVWQGGSTVQIKWSAPSTVALVDVIITDGNTPANEVIVRRIPASQGFINYQVPRGTLAGDGVVGVGTTGQLNVQVRDSENLVDEDNRDFDGILPIPNENWDFTPTDANMTVHFQDVDFSQTAGAAFAVSEYVPLNGEVIYIGAFYTDENGNLVCGGYALLDPTVQDDGDGDPFSYVVSRYDDSGRLTAAEGGFDGDTGSEGLTVTEGYAEPAATNYGSTNINEPITITVYGDDLNTIAKDGFAAGAENIRWFIYREDWDAHSQANRSQLDDNTRELGAYDNDETPGNVDGIQLIQYTTNGISDGSTIGQLIFFDDAFQTEQTGEYTAQVATFPFTLENFETDQALENYTPLNTGEPAWFWISSFLDHDGINNPNNLGYEVGVSSGNILDDAEGDNGAGPPAIPFGVSRPSATEGQYELDIDGAADAIGEFPAGLGTAVTTNASVDAGEAGFFHWDASADGADGAADGGYVLGPHPTDLTTAVDAASANNTFVIMKNGRGDVYWNIQAEANFDNGIATGDFQSSATWNNLVGYQILINPPNAVIGALEGDANDISFLRMTGTKIDPSTPIQLSQGWNLVPNLRGGQHIDTFADIDQLNIAEGMASIGDPSIIVKDVYGDIYWPAFNINTIENMREMHAYFVYVTEDDVLRYPDDDFTSSLKRTAQAEYPVNEHYVVDFNSDNSAVVMVPVELLLDFPQGAEVGFFNSRGDLVGATVYTGGNVASSIWGQSSLQDPEEKGLLPGEEYSIRVYDPTEQQEMQLTDLRFVQGSQQYQHNGINVIAGASFKAVDELPQEFNLSQNYPNPFNPTTVIGFSLPQAERVQLEVFNIAGQRVALLIDRELSAGQHQLRFDASSLASGMYIYRIRAGEFSAVRKMSLIR